jgi:hypothetical protein
MLQSLMTPLLGAGYEASLSNNYYYGGDYGVPGSPGGGDGTNSGGTPGGTGGGGGGIEIRARIIKRSASTPAGVLQAKGGNAGACWIGSTGNIGGASGAGGGGGGYVIVIFRFLIGSVSTGLIDVTGGQAAAGGARHGTGVPGDSGAPGGSGVVTLINLSAGTITTTGPGAPGTPGVHTSTTGGVAPAPTTAQVNL